MKKINLSIKARIALVISFLALLLIVGGGMGMWGFNYGNDTQQTMYKRELAAAIAVSQADIYNARGFLAIYRLGLSPENPGAGEQAKRSLKLFEQSDKAWADYLKLVADDDPEEKRLASDLGAKRTAFADKGYKAIVNAHDAGRPEDVAKAWGNMRDLFNGTSEASAALQAYQAKRAESLYDTSVDVFRRFVAITCVSLLLVVVISVLVWRSLRQAIVSPIEQALRTFRAMAGGDLTTRIVIKSRDEMGEMLGGLQSLQQSLADLIRQVRQGVEHMDAGAREIAAGNTDLSSRTEQQAASLEETAASMEELASTVKQNADNARQANQLSTSSMDVARRGGVAVDEVVGTMREISQRSSKIADIVNVIDGIAFQTNILALNAAVEAARAGEQGKGFAVVAGEVRSLAQRSAQAAKEIKQLIEDSTSKVSMGSDQAERAGSTMQEIVGAVQRVTDIMGEIAAASSEQADGIEQVNRAVNQMDEVTQQNAALVEEAAAATASLEDQARELKAAVARFKLSAADVIEADANRLGGISTARLAVEPALSGQAVAG
ncbi:methyl-accepting chemotaxis protein [Achromobacter aloeverae]|uniref:Methyl-accepting chemotaxis protein n=1 Tax=Achromobacter aloeverae TaxID=1750518 RepID=A0A4Q1HF45_9BURK|nr:methyl-accepting chemotaxis protein [Achromobacter aloeverae]RXN83953.1 methyl-accepting chemotaxis protein [Achromobacter aloeverae]